jgi:predicted small integral membrane protein
MSKLTLLAIVGLIYIGVVKLAYFMLSVFFILLFGMSLWELIRTAGQPAKHPFATQ